MTSGGARRSAGRRGRTRRALAGALAAAILASGCVAPSAERPVGAEELERLAARRDARAAALDTFRVRGGLGIWNDERSVTARVDWRQRGEMLDVGLSAPLGLGSARLIRDRVGARLERGNAPPLVGGSADDILQSALGLPSPVPLDQLAAWLRGLPGDGRDVRRDAAGRLESLRWRDAGGSAWQARVLDWTELDGLELPSLVTARGAGYRMRLVLRDWSAGLGPDPFAPAAEPADDGGELAPEPSPPSTLTNGRRRLRVPGR